MDPRVQQLRLPVLPGQPQQRQQVEIRAVLPADDLGAQPVNLIQIDLVLTAQPVQG